MDTQPNEPTNKNSTKNPKLIGQQIRKSYNTTLGFSVKTAHWVNEGIVILASYKSLY